MPRLAATVHKVIITGTGRAGTTFLVELLTEVGLDTGYSPGNWSRDYFEHCSAGLEQDMLVEESPYVVKNPTFCQTLPELLATGCFAIDHVLVPIRELDDAAKSRIRIGGLDGALPGGLLGTSDPAAQKGVLAEGFHRLMHTLAAYDIPHTLLDFPRFAVDADYAWRKLGFLAPGMGREAFVGAFRRTARPELIHRFGDPSSVKDGRAGERFLRSERRKRWLRRGRRVAAALVIIAAAVLAAWIYSAHERASAPSEATATQGLPSSRP